MTDEYLIAMLRNNVGVSEAACRAAKAAADRIEQLIEALDAVLAWHDKDKHTAEKMTFERSSVFAKARAASKKGGA